MRKAYRASEIAMPYAKSVPGMGAFLRYIATIRCADFGQTPCDRIMRTVVRGGVSRFLHLAVSDRIGRTVTLEVTHIRILWVYGRVALIRNALYGECR